MRKFFLLLLITLFTFGLAITDAEAKRFGGGRSFGMQRSVSSSSFSRPQSMPNQAPVQNRASKWLGPLAGLALGGLLGYLFMGHGLASGILTWLAIGAAVLLLINFLRNRTGLANQTMGSARFNENPTQQAASQFMANSSFANSVSSYPTGFDKESFLRDAKVNFIRLQAAYDQKNLADLREFTSPEVFAEIQLQLQERGNAENKTEVVTLDADLLDASTEFERTLASVRFSGLIREDQENAAPFNEIWHFQKDYVQSRWIVAGIQQH